MREAAPVLSGDAALMDATTFVRTSMDYSGFIQKGGKEAMKKNASRTSSEKGQRSSRRRQRDHNRSKWSSQIKLGVDGRTSGFEKHPIPRNQGGPEIVETQDVSAMTQSGVSQGTAATKSLRSESIGELIEEGANLDNDSVGDFENPGETDASGVETDRARREEAPAYRNRNRI
jgi:hypothetical protein